MKVKKISVLLLILAFAVPVSAELPEYILSRKKENFYVGGMPAVNYNSDAGFGIGAVLFLYNNGKKKERFFSVQPYSEGLKVMFYGTTKNYQFHELTLDAYNIFGSNVRFNSTLCVEINKNAAYFGTGADAASGRLTNPVTGHSYNTMSGYMEDFLKKGDRSHYKYNRYQYTAPKWKADFYSVLVSHLIWSAGLRAAYTDVKSWKGRSFRLNGSSYVSGETLFDRERPFGADGGFTNVIRLGIGWKDLDYIPDPRRGIYADLCFDISRKFFGSVSDYIHGAAGIRGYVSPVADVTLASRIAMTSAFGDIPFFEMGYFPFMNGMQQGLGGNRTLRGYCLGRFTAKTMTLANLEIRYSFLKTGFLDQIFDLKLILFTDAGNAYDKTEDPFISPRWRDYKICGGAGLAAAWNLATVIHFYYGVSREDSAVSVDLSHAID